MSAASLTAAATADAHRAFDAALPRIDAAIRYHFRRRPRLLREEAIAEARAYTWAAWHGLLRRGMDPVAVGAVAIAANACRAVTKGRSVGTSRPVGRGAMDVYHPRVRLATGLRVVAFEELAGAPAGAWRDWLAGGRRYGPAEEAAFRIDFAAWLDSLPPRKRRVAELLAEGLRTGEVARRLGVTPGAVSQTRGWLAGAWGRYQGDADATS
jgi:DNA-directed RNA polymerase specialized sigma24 family protein